MKCDLCGDELIIDLPDVIDSNSAQQADSEINEILNSYNPKIISLNAKNLKYISSAGLRIILRIRKNYQSVRIFNVSTAVHEIMSITGFTEILSVETAYKNISVEGCEVIGKGMNGRVYRLKDDQVVKVYYGSDALEDIQLERKRARAAFVAGINTAIPFEVVTVDDIHYGTVFELINARSIASLLRQFPEKTDEYITSMVKFLKNIHSRTTDAEFIPSAKQQILSKLPDLSEFLGDSDVNQLRTVLSAIPENHHLIHNDFQLNNIMISNGEPLLLDMETLSYGEPILEFAAIYASLQGYRQGNGAFFNLDYSVLTNVWTKLVQQYWNVEDITEIEQKCQLISLPRILRHTLKKDSGNLSLIDFCKNTLKALLNICPADFLGG